MNSDKVADALTSIFQLSPQRRTEPKLYTQYLKPSSGSEVEAMRADFTAAGNDMRLALNQYGQRA